MLTLHEFMWRGDGPSPGPNDKPIGYEVVGLPNFQRAWIATDNHSWQVLRESNGVLGEWYGRFERQEEALLSI